jgi:hypothetical protein
MQIDVEHTLRGIEPEALERLYFDEAFNEAMCRAVRLDRTLVQRRDEGGVLERAVRISPDREIPAPVAKILGAERIGYVEHVRAVWGSGQATWRTEPTILANKISSDGTIAFAAAEGGTTRRVRGHVTVKIFGLGGTIERFIVADVARSYAEAAAFTQRWIDGQA